MPTPVRPRRLRVACAFIVAPAVAPLLWMAVAAALGSPTGIAFGLFALLYFAYLPALVIGLPIYFAARRRMHLTPVSGAIAGALTAVTPWVAVAAASLTAGVVPEAVLPFAVAALMLGAGGGWLFWLIAAWQPHAEAKSAVGG